MAPARLPDRRRRARPVPDRVRRRAIGLGLAAQRYGAQYFGDSSTPSGYLTSDQIVSQSQAEEVLTRWEPGTRTLRTAVLGKGLEFKPIMMAPEESQFLDTQRLTVQQVCRIYGVPPELGRG